MTFVRAPLGLKQPPAKPRPLYLAAVRQLPCCICEAWGLPQLSRTYAHHPIHDRHSQARRPDETAIPLCEGHHQGLIDGSKLAIHRAPQAWREEYGPDTNWIAPTQDRLAHLLTDTCGKEE